ncbi:UNVERIFIED_CONTAM: hypothetical protein RMT77_000185 [Armadillidium vulgare]
MKCLLLIFCLLGATVNIVFTFTYEAPENCEWNFRDAIKRAVSLSCNLRTITSDFDSFRFSVAQSDYTVELKVFCSAVLFFQSSLQPRTFQRLYNLDSLTIEYCKLTSLPPGTFLELDELKYLAVRSHNSDWSAMSLELSQESLIGMPKLEHLDLGQNNIWNLPDRLFCPLPSLRHLNLTWNRLQDVSEIGVNGGCSAHLMTLDLSGNDLVVLPEEGLAGLRSLRLLLLQYNDISMLSDRALAGLSSLNVLNISSNRLVALPPDVFNETIALRELYLQNNSISVLAPSLFSNLNQLTVLDMSDNQLSSDWVNSATFKGLFRLVVLGLSHNQLIHVESGMFHDLSTLQVLDLSYNFITSLNERTFSHLANLHRLDVSFNRLSNLDGRSLAGLHVLSALYVSHNNLTHIEEEAFINCSNMRDLRLDYNYLNEIPSAVSLSPSVRTIRLSHNLISGISSTDLTKLSNLRHADLSNNFIRGISKDAFIGLNELEVLDLSNNEISSIPHGIFDTNKVLELLRLDGNKLNDINGLFASLPKLLWLNVSDNEISWFDYALIPEKLLYLDLRNNKIEVVGNYFNIEDKLRLRTLDISHNIITRIGPSSIPNSVELLFLNSNRISNIAPGTFAEKRNLSMVDLYDNLLSKIDLNSISLPPIMDDKKLPEFYIGGNPVFCDCQMEWMHRVHQITSLRQHPRVMDLDKVTCTLPYPRSEINLQPFLETHPSQFLCPYSSHCFALCQCCDFIACDCQMNCPTGCSCYHDDTWATNIVDCSSKHHNQLPDDIPMDATIVYMDGNEMPSLEAHHLIGRKNLRSLFINNSYVERIQNRTFHGLSSLKILHLEDNLLTELRGFEFEHLEHLRELYLQNNKLKIINNSTFLELKSIEMIRLDNNHLTTFPIWQFNLNKGLKDLTLSQNSWSCECFYMVDFKNWIKRYNDIVKDSKKIICMGNSSSTGPNVLETSYSCENYVATSIVQEKIQNDYLQPVLITLGIFFIILLFGVAFAMIRLRIQKSVSKKCGLKWFPPDGTCNKKGEKNLLYDAFVSHSEMDANFVSEIFVSELENGDPCYKLCLLNRDCESVSNYAGDFIIKSIESSRKIILVVTKNFIDNDWCKFTFKAAHLEALKSDQNKVIAVFCNDVSESDLDSDLHEIISNSTILKFEDKSFWNKLRSCMPLGKKNVNQQCFIAETNYIMRNNLSSLTPSHDAKPGQLLSNMVLNGPVKSTPPPHSSHQHIHSYQPNRQSTNKLLHHHHHTLQQLGPTSFLHHQNPHHHHHQQLSGGSEGGDMDKTFISVETAQSSISPSLSHSYMSIDYIPSKGSHIYASIDESAGISGVPQASVSSVPTMLQLESHPASVHTPISTANSIIIQEKPHQHHPHNHPVCQNMQRELPIISPSYFI